MMERIKPIDALHVGGSIASITGISLLAIGSVTDNLQFATILSYAMSASLFIGVAGVFVYLYRYAYTKIESGLGKGIAISISAIVIPLVFWFNFYFILLLKSLARHEFTWLLEQIAK